MDVYGRVRRCTKVFLVIVGRREMNIGLYGVDGLCFRIEFDGDTRFYVAPRKLIFSLIFIDVCDVF